MPTIPGRPVIPAVDRRLAEARRRTRPSPASAGRSSAGPGPGRAGGRIAGGRRPRASDPGRTAFPWTSSLLRAARRGTAAPAGAAPVALCRGRARKITPWALV